MKVIDAALTTRIGQLDVRAAEEIEKEATSAFLNGLAEPTALDLARGLHWIAQGHPLVCSSEYIVEVLGPPDLATGKLRYLADLLDISYTLSYERQVTRIPLSSRQPPLWLDAAMLGWRISLGFELLNYNGLMAYSL
jgi:hypothetical protein